MTDELKTVARQWRWGGDERWRYFGPIFDDEPREVRELVTRPQAEAIIAALQSDVTGSASVIEHLTQRAERAEGEISEIAGHLDCEPDSDSILHTIREIQADNAALTARVKRLDTPYNPMAEALATDKVKALETQLAAARKALEILTLHANSLAIAHLDRTENNTAIWKALAEARAALEDRP